MSNVVTKVIDVRHKAPDQAIHELMQAAKDGFAVTKIATRFNHTHVYLEASSRQVSTKQVSTSDAVGETSSKQASKAVDESSKEVVVEPEATKVEPAKTTVKKTTSKSVASTKATTTAKKVEQGDKDAE